MDEQKPKVGVGVMIFKDGKVLIGKRKARHAFGTYSPPGGHMEYAESFEQAVRREVMEECGLEIENVKFLCVYNQQEYLPDHYINFGFTADWKSGDPKVLEPEKCESWAWYDPENLPEPLFATIPKYVIALKTGKNYFDSK
jgi:8-oxo-dGTP diphosphatase